MVEEIVQFGRPYHYGLEAGSKPELLAVMAMLDDEEALIICNGYKDEEYIETALLASKLGRTVILVVEKLSELRADRRDRQEDGRAAAHRHPRQAVGQAAPGAGRPRAATARSSACRRARWSRRSSSCASNDLLDCFELLHFHLGSQISAIRAVKNALREAGRFYVELCKLGAPLKYLDVGGGLGVDYDGSQTNFASSMNYTLQEYANDIVFGSWRSATRPACRTRPSSPSRAARWSRTTRCWSSTSWASASSTSARLPDKLARGRRAAS